MNDKNYVFYDDEGNRKTGGDATEQEKQLGEAQQNTASGEYDPEKHPDNYIMRM